MSSLVLTKKKYASTRTFLLNVGQGRFSILGIQRSLWYHKGVKSPTLLGVAPVLNDRRDAGDVGTPIALTSVALNADVNASCFHGDLRAFNL